MAILPPEIKSGLEGLTDVGQTLIQSQLEEAMSVFVTVAELAQIFEEDQKPISVMPLSFEEREAAKKAIHAKIIPYTDSLGYI